MASTLCSNPVTDRANTSAGSSRAGRRCTDLVFGHNAFEHACPALSWHRSSGALALLQLKIQARLMPATSARQLAQDQLRRLPPIW